MYKNRKIPWFLLLPVLLIMIAFVFIPVIRTFIYSLQNFKLTRPDATKFIGFRNYIKTLESPDFHHALLNSLFIAAGVIVISMTFSLITALILNKKTVITPFLTAAAIIPWALPPVVNGIMWRFIFHSGPGLINRILLGLRITESPVEFTSGRIPLLLISSLVVAWRIIPFISIIFLSSLQSIPGELYEA